MSTTDELSQVKDDLLKAINDAPAEALDEVVAILTKAADNKRVAEKIINEQNVQALKDLVEGEESTDAEYPDLTKDIEALVALQGDNTSLERRLIFVHASLEIANSLVEKLRNASVMGQVLGLDNEKEIAEGITLATRMASFAACALDSDLALDIASDLCNGVIAATEDPSDTDEGDCDCVFCREDDASRV